MKIERRAEIVAAFARVLATHGFARSTMVAVAQEADLSPGLLHHYFVDKDEMLLELFRFLTSRFSDEKKQAVKQTSHSLYDYIDVALALEGRADQVLAKCWAGVLAEGFRNPSLHRGIKRFIDQEVGHIADLSSGQLGDKHASAVFAYVLGSLLFGAYAPRKSKGFAAPCGKILVAALMEKS